MAQELSDPVDPLDPRTLAQVPYVDASALSDEQRAELCATAGANPASSRVVQQASNAGLAAFAEAARMSAQLDSTEDTGETCIATLVAHGFVRGTFTEGVTATCAVEQFHLHPEFGWTVSRVVPETCVEAMP